MSLLLRKTCTAGAVAALLVATVLFGQDTRHVTEPVFPQTCTTLAAQLTIVEGEPSSETAFDTGRVQKAMEGCGKGKAVELVASGSNDAFLIQPISIPSGVTLVVDAGVTVFGSRNPQDYQKIGAPETCGVNSNHGGGCRALIVVNDNKPSNGSGVMGYGVIDARADRKLIVDGKVGPKSWWDLAADTYLVKPMTDQNNPLVIYAQKANNFTLYKITVKNGPMFQIKWSGSKGSPVTRGFTAWGVKVITPYWARNTDGIDPVDNIADVTITDSYISNGDDFVAFSANGVGNPVMNATVSHVHTYSGRGLSLGSGGAGGFANILFDHIDQAGQPKDKSGNGFRIKTASDRGNLTENITFENICQQDEQFAIRLDTFYQKTEKTDFIPTYKNILIKNVTILDPNGSPGEFRFQGWDAAHASTVTLDNVNVSGTPKIKDPMNTHFTITGGQSTPWLTKITGPNVTYAGSATEPAEKPYPCSALNFVPLAAELFVSITTSGPKETNLQAASVAKGTPFTLNAVLEPTDTEYPVPTLPVTFYEGAKAVGTATIGGPGNNGTLATLTLQNVNAGSHTYTAEYPKDKHYAYPIPLKFGTVTVSVQ